jgi:hypothetical protein
MSEIDDKHELLDIRLAGPGAKGLLVLASMLSVVKLAMIVATLILGGYEWVVVGLAVANQLVSTASTFAHFFYLSRTSDEEVTNDMLYQTTIVIETVYTVLAPILSPLFKAVLACVGALVGLCKRAFDCILKHIVEPAATRIKSGTSFLAEKFSKYCTRCAGVLQKCGGFIAAIPEKVHRCASFVVAPVAACVTRCASVLGRNIRSCWVLVERIFRERCLRPTKFFVRKHRILVGVVSALVLGTLASIIWNGWGGFGSSSRHNVEPPIPDAVPHNATSDNSSGEISWFRKLLQHKSFWAVIAGLCVLSFVLSLIIFAFRSQILAKCRCRRCCCCHRCSRIRGRHKHPPAGEHSDGAGVKNPVAIDAGAGKTGKTGEDGEDEEDGATGVGTKKPLGLYPAAPPSSPPSVVSSAPPTGPSDSIGHQARKQADEEQAEEEAALASDPESAFGQARKQAEEEQLRKQAEEEQAKQEAEEKVKQEAAQKGTNNRRFDEDRDSDSTSVKNPIAGDEKYQMKETKDAAKKMEEVEKKRANQAAKAEKEAANQAAKAEKEAAKKAKEDEKKRAKEEKNTEKEAANQVAKAEKEAAKKAKEDEKKRAKDASKKEKGDEKHQMKEEKEAAKKAEEVEKKRAKEEKNTEKLRKKEEKEAKKRGKGAKKRKKETKDEQQAPEGPQKDTRFAYTNGSFEGMTI